MKYWIFNLKSNLTFEEIKKYEQKISCLKSKIIIAPSLIYLDYFKQRNYITCAQDVSAYDMGEYTGEVNAKQLQSLNTNYVIIGHYERRKYFNETNEVILSKIQQTLKNNLKIVLCIGSHNYESEELLRNINIIYNNIEKNYYKDIIIAYEPYNLIGQECDIDYDKINKNIELIKRYIQNKFNYYPEIIYGGSVNNFNVNDLQNMTIDGFIIGKSALDVDNIFTLINTL